MAKQRVKPIHLILYKCNYGCFAICDMYLEIVPIEAIVKKYTNYRDCKGTFNPKKVTCKRCLKHPDYKEAMDKIKYPLLFWRENAV